MKLLRRPARKPRAAVSGGLAVLHCAEPFILEPAHRLRAAHCLICRRMIGGHAATVIGIAGLAGDACECSSIMGNVFLAHAAHLPIPPAQLATAIHRAMQCTATHNELPAPY